MNRLALFAALFSSSLVFAFSSHASVAAPGDTIGAVKITSADPEPSEVKNPLSADICLVIFPNVDIAKAYCPIDVPPIQVTDFWKGDLLGWACDCTGFITAGGTAP